MKKMAMLAGMLSLGAPMLSDGYGPRYTRSSGYRTIRHLNRSQRWPRARSYKEARALSPFPDRVVR